MDRHRISESQRQFLLDGVQQGLRGRALCDSFGESYRRILTGIGSKARWTRQVLILIMRRTETVWKPPGVVVC